jgi:hypothetical protein
MYLRKNIPGHGLDLLFGGREIDYTAESEAVSAQTISGVKLTGRVVRQDFALKENGCAYAHYEDGAIAAIETYSGHGCTRLWGLELARAISNTPDPNVEQEIVGFALSRGVCPSLILPTGMSGRVLHGDKWDVAVICNYADTPISWEIPAHSRVLCTKEFVGKVLTLPPGATDVLIINKINNKKQNKEILMR